LRVTREPTLHYYINGESAPAGPAWAVELRIYPEGYNVATGDVTGIISMNWQRREIIDELRGGRL